MTKRTRRKDSPGLKAKMALAAIKGEKTLAELPKLFGGHPAPIVAWMAQLQKGRPASSGVVLLLAQATPTVDLMLMHANIGELGLRLPRFSERFLG